MKRACYFMLMLLLLSCGKKSAPTTARQGGFRAFATAHSVTLTCGDTDPGLTGFNFYRSNVSTPPAYVKINPTLLSACNYTDMAVTPGATYYYAVTALNLKGESGFSNQQPVTIPAVVSGFSTIRVIPTAAYTDSTGAVWNVDSANCAGGSFAKGTHAITGTQPGATDQLLYQQERWGPSTCTFPGIPAGTYNVVVKEAESHWTGPGQRLFGITINGTSMISNFDIFATAGGQWKAVDKVFPVTLSVTENIVVQFINGSIDNAKYDSIEIIQNSNTPPPPVVSVAINPTNVSVQVGKSVLFTAVVSGTTNTAVTWSGNAPGGVYTAGNTPGSAVVTAISTADTSKSASATVTITALPLVWTCVANVCTATGGYHGEAVPTQLNDPAGTKTGTVTLP